MAIGRVFPGGSTIHGVPLQLDWTRVVVDQVEDATALVPVTTTEFVSAALTTKQPIIAVRQRESAKTMDKSFFISNSPNWLLSQIIILRHPTLGRDITAYRLHRFVSL